MSEYKPEDLLLMALNCDPDNETAVISMLRAGADAMDALAKAKERVNELEEALRWYGSRGYNCNNYTTIGDVGRDALAKDGGAKARAALQVKP